MDELAKIFGSVAKVKIMRLFLFNQDIVYDFDDITRRAQITLSEAKKEVTNLLKAGLLRKRQFEKSAVITVEKSRRIVRKKMRGYAINKKFQYLNSLQNFLLRVTPIKERDIIERISKIGQIKLLILAGVFIQDLESRVDILVVGDHLKHRALESVIRQIESEIGREIRYAAFETSDFRYRIGMYDKLVRDILDFQHEIIVDKLGISVKSPR